MKENLRPKKIEGSIYPADAFKAASDARNEARKKKGDAPHEAEVITDFDQRKANKGAEEYAAQTERGLISGEEAALTWDEAAEAAREILDATYAQSLEDRMDKEKQEKLRDEYTMQQERVRLFSNKDLFAVLEGYLADKSGYHRSYIRAISEEYLQRYNKLSKTK